MGNGLDTIFKAYDVRGLYPDEIDEDVARRVGNAFATFTGAERLVIVRDPNGFFIAVRAPACYLHRA